jgi:uncharacterized membrane protein YagU involved in acid resistance
MSANAEVSHKIPSAIRVILSAGLTAGVLDITAAFIVYARFGTRTVSLLQGIASGLLGPAAFQGGLATALLGLLFHFFIATSAAAVYYVTSRRVLILVRHALVSGALYGVGVAFFMQLVVIPLSAIGPQPFDIRQTIVGVIIHIFCVGLPIALTVRRFSPNALRV